MAVDIYSDIDILKGMSMLEKIARFFVLIGEDSTVKIFQYLDKIMLNRFQLLLLKFNL